jgi:hypothetical protein
MSNRTLTGFGISLFLTGLLAGNAVAGTPYAISWLDMSNGSLQGSIAPGGPVFDGQTFNLPGYGTVGVSFPTSTLNHTRNVNAALNNGSISSGADTYSWSGTPDQFSAVNFFDVNGVVNYSVTYTFLSGPVSAGKLAFAASGIGRFKYFGTEYVSSIAAAQNSAFLGDFDLPGATASTQYTGGFTLINSQPSLGAPGEAAFNTDYGIVRIDDSISSLTVNVSQIGQDGLGFTVGYIGVVPEPTALAALCIPGFMLTRRRR